MNKADVQIGGKYSAKIGGRLTVVEILEERPTRSYRGGMRTHWIAKNLKTGREVRILSAAKLRSMVEASPNSAEGRFDRFCGYLAEAGVSDPVLAAHNYALLEAGVRDGRIHDAALVAYSRMKPSMLDPMIVDGRGGNPIKWEPTGLFPVNHW